MLAIIQKLLLEEEFQSQVKYVFRKFQPNDRILSEGAEHENMYVIQSGKVRVHVSGVAGKSANIHPGIADLGPENIFGEVNLFDNGAACADVIAVTETELIEIEAKSFRDYLDRHPDVGYRVLNEIMKIFIKRMKDSNKKIIHLLEWGIQARNIDKDLE